MGKHKKKKDPLSVEEIEIEPSKKKRKRIERPLSIPNHSEGDKTDLIIS